jgi:PPM family protein phosphatase
MSHNQRISGYGVILFFMLISISLFGCDNKSQSSNEDRPREQVHIHLKPTQEINPVASRLRLDAGSYSTIGNFREFNEDSIAITDLGASKLFVIGDGMGGKIGEKVLGKVVFDQAFEALSQELRQNLSDASTTDENRKILRRAIVSANQVVMTTSEKDAQLRNTGTSIALALWSPKIGMYITGVGDCRGYLIRNNEIKQLTIDHSLAQALVEAGTISPEEVKNHRFRNVLWKYLGSKEVGEGPEVQSVGIQSGDQILLCTKGITEIVSDEKILIAINSTADIQKCAETLCQLALDMGSRKNVSCIVIGIKESK